MTTTELIGFGAASCTTLSFVPQVLKVWRTRSVADISLVMYLVFFIGVAQWLAYGVCLHSWPVIVANALTLLLAGAVLVMKLLFGGTSAAKTDY